MVTRPKRTFNAQSVQSSGNEDGLKPTLELYGEWQLEPLQLPHAVNGVVPKVFFNSFWQWLAIWILWSSVLVFWCSILIHAKMSPRMNEAKLMYGQISAFRLVLYTWGYQDYSRLQRDLASTTLLLWSDLIIAVVGAFQFLMGLLSVPSSEVLSWRYVFMGECFFFQYLKPFIMLLSLSIPDLLCDLVTCLIKRWSYLNNWKQNPRSYCYFEYES